MKLNDKDLMYLPSTGIIFADWKPTYRTKNLTNDELWNWVKKATKHYYLRLRYLLRRLKKLNGWTEFKMDAIGLHDLLVSYTSRLKKTDS
jgi:hypothetical protein